MLFWILDISRTVPGAVKERYWIVPRLISWRLFRGDYVVLWLSSLGWWRLACYSRHWSRVNFTTIYRSLICNSLRGLPPDNLGKWWKFWYFSCLRSVNCSYGVKTLRFWFKVWAAAWTFPSQLLWTFLCWGWFCPFGRPFRESGLLAALAPR